MADLERWYFLLVGGEWSGPYCRYCMLESTDNLNSPDVKSEDHEKHEKCVNCGWDGEP